MNDRIQVIESKLDGIGQMIEGLGCFGRRNSTIDADHLKNLAKEMQDFKEALQQKMGAKQEILEWYTPEQAAVRMGLKVSYVRELLRRECEKAGTGLKGKKDTTKRDDKAPWFVSEKAIQEWLRRRWPKGSGEDVA